MTSPASVPGTLHELRDIQFDHVVTVCGQAHEPCALFPGRTNVIHVGFDDPPRLAQYNKDEQEALGPYRRVRDEIRRFVESLPGTVMRVEPKAEFIRSRQDSRKEV